MDPATHLALSLPAKRAALAVGLTRQVKPGPGQIAVRARAVAVNPFDRYIQTLGDVIAGYLTYPVVPGTDVAGEVVALGQGVTRFGIGDHVLGHAAGIEKRRNNAAEGAFQEVVLLLARMAAPMPAGLSFEDAAVLPLGLSTAACGLFQKDFLSLVPQRVDPLPTGQVVLVWGGSTSVGSNAIQLARATGYEVVTTCSPHNHDYVRRMGATEVFDYRSPMVCQDIVKVMAGREVAGAVSIGKGAAVACMDILAQCKGRRLVARASPPTSFADVPAGAGRSRKLVPAVSRMIAGHLWLALNARQTGVATKMIWGGSLIDTDVGPMRYEGFLPDALARGLYAAMPPAQVVRHGLQCIPEAMERQRRCVSACKLVVTL